MATHLLVWTGFVGWIIAGQRGSYIRITAIIARLQGTAPMLAEIVIQLLVAAFGLI
ncbi:MAG: TRAP transporter small permease subunit [Geminicoccaceae bacterium]